MSDRKVDADLLNSLQSRAFAYFLHETNPNNGLVLDKTQAGAPASIAAVGLALTAYPVGVERGFMTREAAVRRVLATLQFFDDSEQGSGPATTGYKGFYYHFLDMNEGKRVWNCELSTVDSAFLFAGMLAAAAYFQEDTSDERQIRELAERLYRRADWAWAQNGGLTVTHGWRPESGFLPFRWEGYDEALFLYLLGLGSPTHPLQPASYAAWCSTYNWRRCCDYEYLFSGPLFTHQISHIWIDFESIRDDFMRARGIDYFENSRRATFAQQQYAINNPQQYEGYGSSCWGITASDGPGPAVMTIDQRDRVFFGYEARGVPHGPDDGTVAPWAVVASLPFAPEIVLPALHYFESLKLREKHPYGYKATFNRTFKAAPGSSESWESPFHFGLNQGPIVLMIENYRSRLLWRLLRSCPFVVAGLRRAGFDGGWLNKN